jgi:hypothetical protein
VVGYVEKEINAPLIRNGFTNTSGQHFGNIREVAFTSDNFCGNIGKLVAETQYDPTSVWVSTNDGVYIYQQKGKKDIAYRIYKGFADYKFNGYGDDKLVSTLVDRQSKIKLTDFPTGIISKDGYVIGQEIIYYENAPTLYDYSIKTNKNKIRSTKLYLGVLRCLKEMYDNGISYLDGHPKNFVLSNDATKPIDFEASRMAIDYITPSQKKILFGNFKMMIEILNENFRIADVLGKVRENDNFEDTFENVMEMDYKLIKSYRE